jgi:hypothetical protein
MVTVSAMDTMSGIDTIEMRGVEMKDTKEGIPIPIGSGDISEDHQDRDPQAMIPTGGGTTPDRDQIAMTGTIAALETDTMRGDGTEGTPTIGLKGEVLATVVTNTDADVLDLW